MRRVRSGPSIAEFLNYYVLVLLSQQDLIERQLIRLIREQSADNRNYRKQGALWIAVAEMRKALARLEDEGFIKTISQARWRITAEGRRRLVEYESLKQQETNGKDQAAQLLLERAGLADSQSSVLDVGTGEGYLALKLAEQGFRVTGVDSGAYEYSRESLAMARQRARESGLDVDFVAADVVEIARQASRFDLVVSSDAIHCMKEQWECLRAFYQLLRPGGRCLCLDLAVGLKGFFVHGFHSFLAIAPEEWQQQLPHIGFQRVQLHPAGDYVVIEAHRPSED
jgi:2-polyprenyl-3-methyl-5-hydroxy-6-metoxy-1,4-benzoquinol methylase